MNPNYPALLRDLACRLEEGTATFEDLEEQYNSYDYGWQGNYTPKAAISSHSLQFRLGVSEYEIRDGEQTFAEKVQQLLDSETRKRDKSEDRLRDKAVREAREAGRQEVRDKIAKDLGITELDDDDDDDDCPYCDDERMEGTCA